MIEYSEGDKVRATHKKTREVHEFEVGWDTHGQPTYIVTTSRLVFYSEDWAFEKLTPPLPTKAGLYKPYEAIGIRYLLLTTRGEWFWVDFEGDAKNWAVAEIVPTPIAQSYAATMTPVYLYDA